MSDQITCQREPVAVGPYRFVCEHGVMAHREIEAGTVVCLVPLTFGRARITLGPDLYNVDNFY